MRTALHPQAKFDPIPPDLDLHNLIQTTPNFEWVLRVSVAQIRNLGQQELEKLVLLHVIQGGRPLVIEKWNEALPSDIFSVEWLEEKYDKKRENARDITKQTDIPMTMGHYLRAMRKLANQWTPLNFRDERRQRLYLKDIDCPPEWEQVLRKVIPPNLFYMNENATDRGTQSSRKGGPIRTANSSLVTAGDLMSSLPPQMRAENLMCYIGHEGTYTPAHREMCASLGQNIMVEASKDTEDGELEGSSIWFMTESKDREVVREYFLSMLGHDIEIEKHFAQINAWKKATFPVYVVEQKPGDFILIPPLAPHQVWNRGTRTMKVAWNRTTVETLELALYEALPKARLVCRDEQYKNKSIVYYTLHKYYQKMTHIDPQDIIVDEPLASSVSLRQQTLVSDFRRLFLLFADILGDEMFGFKETNVEYIEFDSNITCSYCRANIFNRFLTCKNCIRILEDGDEDTYDICMECYAMGRSCFCISNLQWCEQWKWDDLVANYEKWRAMVIRNDGFVDLERSPLPLELVSKRKKKKTLAQVCQEGLTCRPFKDILNARKLHEDESEPEPEVDSNGKIKKSKRRNTRMRASKGPDTKRCHVCGHPDFLYKMQTCSTPGCNEAYCYGTLYRGFDQMPQDVQQMENWQCPKCLGICNCGYCRRAGAVNYYLPKRTLLGHDTRPIADDRSVESLVDFRMHNLSWLKHTGEDARSNTSKRMQQLRAQAEQAKSRSRSVQEAAEGVLSQGASEGAGASPTAEDDLVLTKDIDAALAVADVTYADAFMTEKSDTAMYPDLDSDNISMMSENRPGFHELPGMGYYQQDDGDDRILFDPYKVPSKESLQLDDPEVSEFVRKSIQAAKRRSRHKSDDDTEFAPHPRLAKKPKKDIVRASVNLEKVVDPALLEAGPALPCRPSSTTPTASSLGAIRHNSTNPTPTMTAMEGYQDNAISPPVQKSLTRPQSKHQATSVGAKKPRAGSAMDSNPPALMANKARKIQKQEKEKGQEDKDIEMAETEAESIAHDHTGKSVANRSTRPAATDILAKPKAALSEHNDSTNNGLGLNGSQYTKRKLNHSRKSVSDSASTSTLAPHKPSPPCHSPDRGRTASKPLEEKSSKVHDGSEQPIPTPAHQLLSMAERMKIRGRAFRIGQRGGTNSSANSRDKRKNAQLEEEHPHKAAEGPSNGKVVAFESSSSSTTPTEEPAEGRDRGRGKTRGWGNGRVVGHGSRSADRPPTHETVFQTRASMDGSKESEQKDSLGVGHRKTPPVSDSSDGNDEIPQKAPPKNPFTARRGGTTASARQSSRAWKVRSGED
ncbi:AT hook domain-containing protein [Ceratocystis lukuohia]|uniref:AT hook domain-containing protein n=1 Tax=Ceratocystis lukuohia TaxID=2019550 RepID=A0ABR4MUM8_9PEZI